MFEIFSVVSFVDFFLFFSDGIFLKTFFVVVEGGIPGRVSCQLLSV